MIDNILVTAFVLLLIGGVVWFFWLGKRVGTRVGTTASGFQEAMILVKGGYSPDVLILEHGKPVRLNFRREESASCSETVVLPAFGKSARLPEGEIVPVEFLPEEPGEYDFQCQMGMFRGKLIVE